MDQKGKVALVTGASSGIGLELARVHASRGGDLIIVARRKERLEDLKNELESRYEVSVRVIVKDLSTANAAEELYKEVNAPVDYLINNAGFGLYGFYYEVPWEKNKEMIRVNVTTLAGLTHLFLQDMVKRKSGKILNVSSVAGFFPGPLYSMYFATKAFEQSLSLALSNEVSGTGVTISTLCPGPVATEFGKVARGASVDSMKKFMSPKKVATITYDGLLKGKKLIVPGFSNKCLIFLSRFMPRSLMLKILRKANE